MATLLRIHPEIAELFADNMDLQSLLHWRATCHTNYLHASSSLKRTLTERVRRFSPNPRHLIDIVTTHGALFAGELALSFILRTDIYRATCLEIYASCFQFSKLCSAILDDPHILHHVEHHSFLARTIEQTRRLLITETLVLHLSSKSKVYIHRSYTSSPTAPITRALCTALSNFVSGYGFGCSHPVLTLRHRALLADKEIPYWTSNDTLCINRLLAHGFSLAVSPTAWAEYRWDFNRNVLVTAEECWRELFLCPSQGRYYGDKGSLVGFFEPLGNDEKKCIEHNMAPFGPMILWRLRSIFYCDYGCEHLDSVTEQGVHTVPVFFQYDPYNEMHERETNCYIRCVSQFYRRFGRTCDMEG